MEIIRTNSGNKDFAFLVQLLDQDLAVRDGDEHDFYHQFNGIDSIRYVIVLKQNEEAVSCGAIKQLDETSMEVKRMYTLPAYRGQGLAGIVLSELENWAKELGYQKCMLETGKKQPEAIALYHKNGYSIINNYGQYAGVENSVCFEKVLV